VGCHQLRGVFFFLSLIISDLLSLTVLQSYTLTALLPWVHLTSGSGWDWMDYALPTLPIIAEMTADCPPLVTPTR
jgi:hypothetical protein